MLLTSPEISALECARLADSLETVELVRIEDEAACVVPQSLWTWTVAQALESPVCARAMREGRTVDSRRLCVETLLREADRQSWLRGLARAKSGS